MTRARTHVGVEVGDGLVARFGDALVLVAEPSRYSQGTEQLLEAVESMASEAGSSGARIAVRLAAMITGPGPAGVPPFGVVAPTEDAYVVLLHGPVWVEVTGPDGVERFSGEQAVTWVDRRLGSLGDRLTMGSGEGPVSVDPRSDLRAGLVPGSGFVLTAAAGGRGTDLADAAASHGGSFQPSTTSTDPEPEPAPVPVAERAPMAQPAPVAQPGPVAEAGVADLRTTGPSATGDEAAEPEAAEPGPDDATVSNVEVVEADGVYYGRAASPLWLKRACLQPALLRRALSQASLTRLRRAFLARALLPRLSDALAAPSLAPGLLTRAILKRTRLRRRPPTLCWPSRERPGPDRTTPRWSGGRCRAFSRVVGKSVGRRSQRGTGGQ